MPEAFYCPVDDVIAYDGGRFFPDLFREVGPFANALVLAHEWGHAIQRWSALPESSTAPTILIETQSDCYAGAWAGSVASRTDGGLTLASGDLADGLVGLVEFRDPVGLIDPTAEEAHGSAFDRVSAFQEGFDGGVDRCARWLTDPPTITQTPFQDPLDLARGGNAPYADALDFAAATLDTYWSAVVDGFEVPDVMAFDPDDAASVTPCPSLDLEPGHPEDYEDHVYYCPDDNSVRFDDGFLRDIHLRVGDFAVAVLLSKAWATAVQSHVGFRAGPRATSLHADCLTGAWAGSLPVVLANGGVVAARGGPVTLDFGDTHLSAGDLDEVVKVVLLFGDPSRFPRLLSKRQQRAAPPAFARLDAVRGGFVASGDPMAACARVAG
jgi:predicted metalloprotease